MIDMILSINPTKAAVIAVAVYAAATLFYTFVLQHGEQDTRERTIRAILHIILAPIVATAIVFFLRSALAAWIADMIAAIFAHGIDTGFMAIWIAYSIALASWRIFGARSLRTLIQRLIMGVQRVATTALIAVVIVAVCRGGFGFFGAPIFLSIAVLLYWTTRTVEDRIDRRDRLTYVVRRYA